MHSDPIPGQMLLDPVMNVQPVVEKKVLQPIYVPVYVPGESE